MSVPDYRPHFQAMDLSEADAPSILAAVAYSDDRIRRARLALGGLELREGAAVLALGSVGRYEASPASDFDVAFLFDPTRLEEPEARALRGEVIGALRGAGFDVAEKTFDKPIDARGLLRNIGGRNETNESLTYRALLLTESAWLYNAATARELCDAIFDVYRRDTVSRGRHLATLGNDLHRYYRTLCLDYRWKVEEGGKEWATRIMKLRHSRKLWHLANIAVQCGAREADARGEDHDAHLAAALNRPPLERIALTAVPGGRADLARRIFLAYDRFLGRMRDPEVRAELLALRHEDEGRSAVYLDLRDNAQTLQVAAGELFHHLYERHRDHLMRFTIL